MNKHIHSFWGRSNTACFKSWIRKGYAVFSSLGVVVHIGNLSVALVQWISQVQGQEEVDIFLRQSAEKEDIDELCEQQELMLIPIVVARPEGVCHKIIRIKYINCRQWGSSLLTAFFCCYVTRD